MGWADLMRRTWDLDVLACPCGGRFRFVAAIFDPNVVQAILAVIALRETARPPPEVRGRLQSRRPHQARLF